MPQPNLTTVEALSETQIEVTWQPFDHVDDNKPHVYELYIDDYLEYFGNDVIYIARRLTPDTMYHFKLRSCVRDNERQDCSLFSKTLSGTTNQSRKFETFFVWLSALPCLQRLVSTYRVNHLAASIFIHHNALKFILMRCKYSRRACKLVLRITGKEP